MQKRESENISGSSFKICEKCLAKDEALWYNDI